MATKQNDLDGKVVKGTSSADYITNSGNKVTISGGKGNDEIESSGNNVSISGGAGNDSITNEYGNDVTINAGTGDDVITNLYTSEYGDDDDDDWGDDDDDDELFDYSDDDDDDWGDDDYTEVVESGKNVLFQYGGGNDVIYGFNSTSTLKIASGTMSSVVTSDGYDLFLTVGKSTITLSGAAYLDKVNIVNSKGKAVKFTVKTNVIGTDGDDWLTNSTDGAVIDAGKGNDDINNYGDNVSISGGAGKDSISNNGSNVTIDAGKGNDYIENWGSGSNVLIKYSGGNDYIEGLNSTSTIQIASGKMNSVVTANEDGTIYFLKVGNDTITVADPFGRMDGLNIVDSVGKAVKFSIKPNFTTTKGDDSIENNLMNIKIDALAGNDEITNYGAKVTILGGKGDDYIYNNWQGTNVSINGGAGNDTIDNSADNVTIDGGAGNDSIDAWGDNVLVKYSGGKDVISLNDTSTLKIASGTMNSVVTTNGADYFLTVGSNIVTLLGAAGLDTLNIVDSKGKAVNFIVKTDYNFTEGNDSVENLLDKVKLDALGGNDFIYNRGSKVTIYGGDGNDVINNAIYRDEDEWYTIDGVKNVTIDGGKGNDSISNAGEKVLIKYSGGNDSIYGFNSTSTLKIASGTMNSVVTTNGTDLFLTVGNDTITLEEAAALDKVNIVDSKGKAVNYSLKTNFAVSKGNDSVTNYLSKVKIDALAGNDDITNYGNKVTIVGGTGNDSIYNGDWSDSLGASVSINAGADDDYIYNVGDKVTINGGKGNDSIDNYGSKVLFQYSGGNDSIYGLNATSTLKIAAGTMNSVVNSNGEDYFLTVGSNIITLAGAADLSKVNIVNSKGKTVKFTVKTKVVGTDGDDNLSNSTNGATIDGGKGRNYISNSGSKVLFQYSGGNDYIYGFDTTSTLKIASGTMSSVVYSDGYDYFLDIGDKSITLSGAADLSKVNIVNSNGKTIKFTVKEVNRESNHKDGAKLKGTAGRDSFYNSGDKVSINAGDGSDTISNYGDYSTLIGGNGDDYINNVWGKKVSISGGAGDDYIENGGDNVTINAGKGDDTIDVDENETLIYANGDGNDVIYANDSNVTIKLTDISKVSADFVEGDSSYYPDVVFTVGKGSITFEEATLWSKEITFVDKDNKTIASYSCDDFGIASDKSVTIRPSFWGSIFADEANFTNVDGSKNYRGIEIVGGSSASTFKGGSGDDTITGDAGKDKIYGNAGDDSLIGGAGNDSLWGGAGDDSLYGGDGKDTFIYKPGEGTDTIFDYASGDMLKILKTDGKAGGTFTDSAFSDGNLTLTISGGGTVIFDGVSAGDKIKINSKTYTIKNGTLK